MLDIDLIREQPDLVRKALCDRQMDPALVDRILALDRKRRSILTETETLKAERNAASKEISQIKDASARQSRIEAMRAVGDKIAALDEQVRQVEAELQVATSVIPNIPDPSTPLGKDEHGNVVLRTIGEQKSFDFEPKPHWDLGPALGILNFEQGVKLTGSRFYVLSGAGARLQRALIAWMLDLHIQQGYVEKYTPFMVRSATLFGAGQLPKFADTLYKDHEEDLYMVPTAEVPLTGLHMDDILDEALLPLHYTAYTPCFRREKMSAGRDVRGIKRGHQFDKVE
ncbi:MAG: serine--tRNA ligase, partial [Anaerolineales bacterium]|nr:serine--tRNA ligase [Anaerolineales bacterium]